MKETKKKQAGWQLPSQLWGRRWGKGSLYLRQALHMMKEGKLFSGIYIAGTALAIAFTMVIAVVYYAKLADIEPEVNRSRTVYVLPMLEIPKNGYELKEPTNYYFPNEVKEWFYPLKSVEVFTTFLKLDDFRRDKAYVWNKDSKPVPVVERLVDANFFKVYHFNFVYGRPFAPTDSVSPICIISQDISEQLFGKGVNPVGKVLNLGSDFRIVGVIEPTSSIAEQSFGQLFMPTDDATNMITIVLKEGCSLADLKQELEEIAHKRSVSSKNLDYSFENRILPHAQLQMSGGRTLSSWKDILLSLFPQVLVLLLVPALNLSGLVAARMKRRLPEMGVRKAFGAKRRELLHQVIMENLVLTLCGGIVGLVITWLLLYVFRSWVFFAVSNHLTIMPEPTIEGEMLFSPFIFLIAFAVCLIVNMMAAVIPAWLSLKNPIVESLYHKR